MSKTTRNRLLAILAVIIGCGVLLAIYPINLGLDLRGGIQLVLEVDPEEAVQAEIEQVREAVARQLSDDSIAYTSVEMVDSRRFVIEGIADDATGSVEALLDTYSGGWNYRSQSGASGRDYTVTIAEAQRREIATGAVRQAREVVSRRIDAYGVAEPTITIYGSGDIPNQIILELPGVDDMQRVKDLILEVANLELKLLHPIHQGSFPTKEAARAVFPNQTVPSEYEIVPFRDVTETGGQEAYLILRRAAEITGSHLKNARRSQDQFTGRSEVLFFLNAEGVSRFSKATGENVNKLLAIVLDGRVVSAPNIESRIDNETAVITGNFTPERADDLAMTLRSGALPAKPRILEERSVGPSLGRDSIVRGLYASLLGLTLVVLGMLVVYRLSGINAIVCLTLNLTILMSILAYFGATLTLPGIAGVILTIGMAVDANILIFERIKEELRLGKTVRTAVSAGFDRVFSTIIDTNITTLVAALFLFQFGTGPVRGFAITLAVGLLANIFTATFVSRTIFATLLQTRDVKTLSV